MANEKKNIKLAVWGLALLFAVMMSVPFLVPGLGFVALLGFTPLLCMDRLGTVHGLKHMWWRVYVAFLLFNIGASYWIWYVSPAGSIATIILNALQMAAIYALFRWCRNTAGRKCPWLPYVIFIVMWLGWEHIYFDIELSWPWLVLGNAFATQPKLVQWYEVTGSLGGSLWILACSTLLFAWLDSLAAEKSKRRIIFPVTLAALVIIPTVFSLIRYYSYEETDDKIEVVVVQPNVDPFMKYGYIPQTDLDTQLLGLIDSVITPDTRYIVTPETFTYDVNLDVPDANESIVRYKAYLEGRPGTTMLLGALTHCFYPGQAKPTRSARSAGSHWYDVFNSAIVMDASGRFEYYHKSKLVPGVEIIPYQNYLPFLGKLVAKFGGSSSSYGTVKDIKALEGGDGNKVGAMICYESVYGDWSRKAAKYGAGFMAVMTNDGWWGDSPGYRQHFRYAGLRAIEMRRDVIHAANTGISGFINQRGDVIQRTDWWVPTSIVGEVNLNYAQTPFTKHGDIIGKMAALLSLAAILLIVISAIRRCVSDRRFARGKSA